jgi:hypothetical protein
MKHQQAGTTHVLNPANRGGPCKTYVGRSSGVRRRAGKIVAMSALVVLLVERQHGKRRLKRSIAHGAAQSGRRHPGRAE